MCRVGQVLAPASYFIEFLLVSIDRHDSLTAPFFGRPPHYSELFASDLSAAATGFCAASWKAGKGPVLWVQDRQSISETGRPFLHGLPAATRHNFIHVAAGNARQTLWAMGEGLKCPSLTAVIGEIYGDPRVLDFTATKRLTMAAERYAVPAFLIRRGGSADLSSARRRWRIASRPSLAHRHDRKAPGLPVWSLDLFRARDMRPGQWDAAYDGATHRLDLVPGTGDESLDQGARQYG
jgi:protein ImuA